MKPNPYLILFALGCVCAGKTVIAQDLMIPAVKDNTLYSESDSSNGKGNYLFTGLTAVGNERRALLQFDLSNIQPADSVVSASLELYLSKTTSGDYSVGLYKIKRSWGEGISDAKFEEGGGATPKPGDATWNYAFYDTSRWNSTGGDHEEIASASSIVGAVIGTCTWTGDKLTSDVRGWINKPDSNFGWMLIIAEQESPNSKRFNSSENVEFQPQLIVNLFQPTIVPDKNEIDLSVFPNPSGGIVYVRGNDLDIKMMRLLDITGREVSGNYFRIGLISNNLISLTILRKGTYLIELNQSIRKKIIII
jgi:hypothetical protein